MTETGGHGRHHDRPEAQQAGLPDRVPRGGPFGAPIDCEVNHHDGVLLDDADQQNNADHGNDRQFDVEKPQRQQRAEACRR
jgi:hypothetical protein